MLQCSGAQIWSRWHVRRTSSWKASQSIRLGLCRIQPSKCLALLPTGLWVKEGWSKSSAQTRQRISIRFWALRLMESTSSKCSGSSHARSAIGVIFVSFDPRLPERMQIHVQRVTADRKMIDELEKDVHDFLFELHEKEWALLQKFGEAA